MDGVGVEPTTSADQQQQLSNAATLCTSYLKGQ
jgi:hypothetical protein